MLNKILKFSIEYSSRYVDINEFIILPLEINGLLFPKLEEEPEVFGDDYDVQLIDVEGKYSEATAFLHVEILNIDEMDNSELIELIEGTNFDLFLGYFENQEWKNKEVIKESEVLDEILKKYNTNKKEYVITRDVHNEFYKQLKSKYVEMKS